MTKLKAMTKLKVKPPVLIAHRGYSGSYPENTLLSYQAAYSCGARYMELDLQMTEDHHPVLHHDASLQRMAGVDLDVREMSLAKFKTLPASYTEQFGDAFTDNEFSSFDDFCVWLQHHPDTIVFVEIKQQSIDRFGGQLFIDRVHDCIQANDVEKQCVIISFNSEVLEYSRQRSSMPIGWVLPKWNNKNGTILAKLNPEYMFCNKKYLPSKDEDIWSGSWLWAIYNLDDVASAIEMANRGMPFLETNQIGTLMDDKRLSA